MQLARVSIVLGLALCAACPYHGRDVADDVVPIDGGMIDAQTTCGAPGETDCNGQIRRVCGADHEWDPAQQTTCDFTCAAGECVAASNVDPAMVMACQGAAMHPLMPTSGTVTVTEPGMNNVVIRCSAGCGDTDEIVATHLTGLNWFCLSAVNIPAGIDVALPPTGGPRDSIAWIVDGPVTIAGRIVFDGLDASDNLFGEGAPGGEDGAAFSSAGSHDGIGACAGQGGGRVGGAAQLGAGGGGGAGGAEAGGAGGDGVSPDTSQLGFGGAGGGATCRPADEVPLDGGAGGGGGASGNCGGACGWPGGGGGGAIQISSRAGITISGGISAHGGDGFGSPNALGGEGGGGGGGAGGGILLEAPSVIVDGTLNVDGGSGGPSLAGIGGAGATGATIAGNGATASGGGQGGAGGGGAGGRIRIRAVTPVCGNASPIASCSTATMP